MVDTENRPGRGRNMLLGLAALFIVPLAAAWLWYLNVDRLPPEGSVAHGELVQPVRPLGEFELGAVDDGAPVTDETLDGRWTIVHVGGAECGEACRQSLYESRQVHIALGRRAVRMQRLYLLVDAQVPYDPGFFAREHDGLIIARVDSSDPWLAKFRLDDLPPAEAGRTYVIDPLGNLMLSYPVDAPPRHLLDDLLRLLRVSRVG